MTIRCRCKILAVLLSLFVVFVSLFYAASLTFATTVFLPMNFQFLISDEQNITVSKSAVDINGGASYLLNINGKTAVVFDCYFSQEKIESAKSFLEKKDVRAGVLTKKIDTLYLSTKLAKSKKEEIKTTLQNLKNCIEVLDGLAKQAETGDFTQERLKQSLCVVEMVLRGMAKSDDNFFESIVIACKKNAENIALIRSDIVFAKDIRYVKVSLCDHYIQFCEQFSI